MVDEVLSICNVSQYHEKWLLDYGASHHMCPHRSWFYSYQVVDGGIVLMGNNVSCNIFWVGSIEIKFFDGIATTLRDVRPMH